MWKPALQIGDTHGASMTSAFFSGSWLFLVIGAIILVYATAMAVRQRSDPRRLILWGALHDLAIICMALCSSAEVGLTGVWLYAIFQCFARLLAWFALKRIAEAAGPARTIDDLAGLGRRYAVAGTLFGLGLLAAVGGSPFLLPEGRALITLGMLEEMPANGFWFLMLMAAMTTIFIWLYVDAVRKICLEKRGDEPEDAEPAGWILRREKRRHGKDVLPGRFRCDGFYCIQCDSGGCI